MPGLKEIDLFLLKELLDSSGLKSHPAVPENPYVLSGLSRYRLDVQHMSLPGREQTAPIPRRGTGSL